MSCSWELSGQQVDRLALDYIADLQPSSRIKPELVHFNLLTANFCELAEHWLTIIYSLPKKKKKHIETSPSIQNSAIKHKQADWKHTKTADRGWSLYNIYFELLPAG